MHGSQPVLQSGLPFHQPEIWADKKLYPHLVPRLLQCAIFLNSAILKWFLHALSSLIKKKAIPKIVMLGSMKIFSLRMKSSSSLGWNIVMIFSKLIY